MMKFMDILLASQLSKTLIVIENQCQPINVYVELQKLIDTQYSHYSN